MQNESTKPDAPFLRDGGMLHCDACGFTGKKIPEPLTPDNLRALIGTRCPKCGADMLTAVDCKAAIKMLRAVDALNRLARFFGITAKPGDKRGTLTVNARDKSFTVMRGKQGE